LANAASVAAAAVAAAAAAAAAVAAAVADAALLLPPFLELPTEKQRAYAPVSGTECHVHFSN